MNQHIDFFYQTAASLERVERKSYAQAIPQIFRVSSFRMYFFSNFKDFNTIAPLD